MTPLHLANVEPGATIAVIGASARAVAFSLLRAGYRVVAADLFADADLAQVCPATRIQDYPNGFEGWLAATECDAWLYTGAMENYPDLIDRMAMLRPLIGHRGDSLRRVRDPLALQTRLDEHDLRFPATTLVAGPQPSSGQIVKKCGGQDEASYWQQFVAGTSLSALFRGAELHGVTRQLVGEAWTGAAEFQYCGSIALWPLADEKARQLERLGRLLHNEFGLTDLYGVDLIDDGSQLWTIEVNPRYTAAVEVVERATGYSVFQTKSGEVGERPSKPPEYFGKAVLFAKESCVISKAFTETVIPPQPYPSSGESDEGKWPKFADIPAAGTEIEIGQPVLTLFARGDSGEVVEDRLRQRAEEIETLLYAKEPQPCD
ncbi:MAG: ATP-grasp domain-containing protein [Planctomycetota bacterium]